MKTVAAILLSFVAGLGVAWMSMSFSRDTRAGMPATGKQMALVVSPDKAYTAKIQLPELGGFGATVSQPYQVWIESRTGESRLVFEADKTDWIKMKWLGARVLEVCYGNAQISIFRNRFIDVDRSGSETFVHKVEVRLRRVERVDECPT